MKGAVFRAKRVLVLEDEPIIALLLEELIEAAGGTAECVATLKGTDEALARSRPDLAILDINIHNQTSFAIAERLSGLRVPFIFASGYGSRGTPPELDHVPTIAKPYGLEELEAAFAQAIARLEGE